MRIRHLNRTKEDTTAAVAGYESMLDLFTLISFTLIIVSFIYAAHASQGIANVAQVKIAEAGTGVPSRLPKDILLIIIHRENKTDVFTVVDGLTGEYSTDSVTIENIDSRLSELAKKLSPRRKLSIVVHKGEEDANPAILLRIIDWLKANDITGCSVYRE